MSSQNLAAVLPAAKAPLEIQEREIPAPGLNEIVYKNEVIGFNPIEAKVGRFAILPMPYPSTLGQSAAGTVHAVGSSITDFKVGDHVVSLRPLTDRDDQRTGSYQQYVVSRPSHTAKLADSVKLEDAAATILNLATAVSVFNTALNIERPSADGQQAAKKGKKIFIYGGSSSVGGFAIKYATDAGYDVVTTSSAANKAFVQSLGPVAVIDHNQSAEAITEEVKKYGPYEAGIFDTIGTAKMTTVFEPYLSSIGGGKFFTVQPPFSPDDPAHKLPENVQRIFGPWNAVYEKPENEELREWFFHGYLPQGLKSGAIVPTRTKKVKGGLKAIQAEVLDRMLKGVSGVKLIVDPWEE